MKGEWEDGEGRGGEGGRGVGGWGGDKEMCSVAYSLYMTAMEGG